MASQAPDFALKLMQKHGWKEGQGLGRTESGISEALKPSLKFDKNGLGFDITKSITNNWWDQAFDKAAKNIVVDKTDEGTVSLKTKEKSKKIKSTLVLDNKTAYSGFIKSSSTLHDGKMIKNNTEANDIVSESDSDSDSEKQSDLSIKLINGQIFDICKGQTAHKGARHGLTMSAKLKRIEEQESKLLKNTKLETSIENDNLQTSINENNIDEIKHKKKKKKKSKNNEYENVIVDKDTVQSSHELVESGGIRRKCHLVEGVSLSDSLHIVRDQKEGNVSVLKKMKKRKNKDLEMEDEGISIENEHNHDELQQENINKNKSHKKKKRKHQDSHSDIEILEEKNDQGFESVKLHKKKKSKKTVDIDDISIIKGKKESKNGEDISIIKDNKENNEETVEFITEKDCNVVKKKKKKKNKDKQ